MKLYSDHYDILRARDPIPVRKNTKLPKKNSKLRVTVFLERMDEETSNEFFDWLYLETPFKGQYTTLVTRLVNCNTYVFKYEADALMMKMKWYDYVQT